MRDCAGCDCGPNIKFPKLSKSFGSNSHTQFPGSAAKKRLRIARSWAFPHAKQNVLKLQKWATFRAHQPFAIKSAACCLLLLFFSYMDRNGITRVPFATFGGGQHADMFKDDVKIWTFSLPCWDPQTIDLFSSLFAKRQKNYFWLA